MLVTPNQCKSKFKHCHTEIFHIKKLVLWQYIVVNHKSFAQTKLKKARNERHAINYLHISFVCIPHLHCIRNVYKKKMVSMFRKLFFLNDTIKGRTEDGTNNF